MAGYVSAVTGNGAGVLPSLGRRVVDHMGGHAKRDIGRQISGA